MFKEHPKGLIVLALTNMGERFGYYTMLAILTLYMQAKFGLSSSETSIIYGSFLAVVYFLPLLGGLVADKLLGYGKTIFLGIVVMFGGYLLLAIPTEANSTGKLIMFGALGLIALGTGFFKGNLQALVGNLYEKDIYKAKRDIAFSIFYMFINIGAFFAPSAANSINNAILRGENFTYDATIAKNYVALNDKVVDKGTFEAKMLQGKDVKSEEEKGAIISKAKKNQGVIFPEDKTKFLFNLKASGLAQLTASKQISSPDQMLTKEEYKTLYSRDPHDKEAQTSIREKVNKIHISDPNIYGADTEEGFAMNFGEKYVANSLSKSYNLAFGVACISLIISILIFFLFRGAWKEADKTHKQQLASGSTADVVVLSKSEVRERVIALLLVFFVVIFFWMSFHQNGLCMTFFARDYTVSSITPAQNTMFSLLALLPVVAIIYGIYWSTLGLFGGKRNTQNGLILSGIGVAGLLVYLTQYVFNSSEAVQITPQIFQQFNPFFIVILTPLAVSLFTYLNRLGKEPSAPRKIGYGMLIAAIGFVVLLVASIGLPAPSEIQGISDVLVSPSWLINTYLVLTIAELFLSPMGLSFVAKVAPPQYKGMMQGGWLAATAIGNYLVGVMGAFWEKLPLYAFWGVLVICCLLSAMFIFSIMKRLERVAK